MPYLSIPKSSRRDFLKTAGMSLGAIFSGACVRIPAPPCVPRGTAHWALLSDTHVTLDPKEEYRGFVINDHMKKAVGQVLDVTPEGAIITGDCARLKGLLGDYDMLWRLAKPMRAKIPVALSLGNHDDRANYRKVFRLHGGESAAVEGKHVLVIDHDAAGVRLIVLDSLRKVNDTPGTLGDAQRRWLGWFLDEADPRPTFLFYHHPPTDRKGDLLDSDKLFDIVMPRKQVKAFFYGHSHVYRYKQQDGLQLINLPAIGYNFSDSEPIGWVDARLSADGGEFTLCTVGGDEKDNGKTTELQWRS